MYKVSFGFINHQNHDFSDSMSCGGCVCIWGSGKVWKMGEKNICPQKLCLLLIFKQYVWVGIRMLMILKVMTLSLSQTCLSKLLESWSLAGDNKNVYKEAKERRLSLLTLLLHFGLCRLHSHWGLCTMGRNSARLQFWCSMYLCRVLNWSLAVTP